MPRCFINDDVLSILLLYNGISEQKKIHICLKKIWKCSKTFLNHSSSKKVALDSLRNYFESPFGINSTILIVDHNNHRLETSLYDTCTSAIEIYKFLKTDLFNIEKNPLLSRIIAQQGNNVHGGLFSYINYFIKVWKPIHTYYFGKILARFRKACQKYDQTGALSNIKSLDEFMFSSQTQRFEKLDLSTNFMHHSMSSYLNQTLVDIVYRKENKHKHQVLVTNALPCCLNKLNEQQPVQVLQKTIAFYSKF